MTASYPTGPAQISAKKTAAFKKTAHLTRRRLASMLAGIQIGLVHLLVSSRILGAVRVFGLHNYSRSFLPWQRAPRPFDRGPVVLPP